MPNIPRLAEYSAATAETETTTPEEWELGPRHVRSTWPDRNPARIPPRSATVVIWKEDGGVIGS